MQTTMLQMLSQEFSQENLCQNMRKWLRKLVKAGEIVSNFKSGDDAAAWR
jgi:hypothetical protein